MGAMQAAFVKFFGRAGTRTAWDASVLDVLARTGAHWAGTYPAGRRPRSVREGDRMFMAQLVSRRGTADIAVFGRALALAYVEGRDDASAEDLALRPWKARWPHYVRVRDGEFIAGTLADAVSLGELMDALGAEAFATTQRNALIGRGNVDPRAAYRQQPAVRLSHEGREWLDARLDEAFARAGRLGAKQLTQLDWPKKDPALEGAGWSRGKR
ncbi:MAG: hypothetical protein JSS99_13455 [Actinobacteria bacterium]|nr:hypothetical protein [Actinomycetota bacterium]